MIQERVEKRTEEIEPDRDYDYEQAAPLCRASASTLRRAYLAGFLKGHRARCNGPGIVFLGSDLLEWIRAGKKTGRTSRDVMAEIRRVA